MAWTGDARFRLASGGLKRDPSAWLTNMHVDA